MSVKERVKQFIVYKGLNVSKFEKLIGVANGYVNSISVSISSKKLDEISNVFPDLNKSWLLLGEGDMLNSSADSKNKNDYLERNNITNARKIEGYVYEELPYISRRARATFAELGQSLVESGEVYSVMKTDPTESLMKQVVIEIDGDSMEPYLISGAKVRCKEIDQGDWLYLNSGVYVVSYGNFVVVKRIKNSPVDGTVMLHSDNTETGGNLAVPIGEIREIWRVLRIVDSPVR